MKKKNGLIYLLAIIVLFGPAVPNTLASSNAIAMPVLYPPGLKRTRLVPKR